MSDKIFFDVVNIEHYRKLCHFDNYIGAIAVEKGSQSFLLYIVVRSFLFAYLYPFLLKVF